MTIKYLGRVRRIKDIEPYAKQYQVFYIECPFCGYKCEVHAIDVGGAQDIYPKCGVCKKNLRKIDKKSRIEK